MFDPITMSHRKPYATHFIWSEILLTLIHTDISKWALNYGYVEVRQIGDGHLG